MMMSRLDLSDRASEETKLNLRVPPQAKVGGKATDHPDGRQVKQGKVVYGERVTHGTEDTIVRYIVIDNGDDVDQFVDGEGWTFYTHKQARGF